MINDIAVTRTADIDEVAVSVSTSTVGEVVSVKKFHVLPHDFSIEAGEMTASLKIKRKVVVEKYRKELEALYRD